MQALEIQADVDQNHEVHFTLPDNWKSHRVKLIVLEEVESQKAVSNELEQINHCAEQLNHEMDDASMYQIDL